MIVTRAAVFVDMYQCFCVVVALTLVLGLMHSPCVSLLVTIPDRLRYSKLAEHRLSC